MSMLFITDRILKNLENSKDLPKKVEFDLSQNASSNEVYFCMRSAKGKYEELGHKSFLSMLAQSPYKQILLYIHGFNNLPEDSIFDNVKSLQSYFDSVSQNFVQVIPIIWPCDNDIGIIKDYWDDQMSADMSAFAFKRAFDFFYNWSCNNKDHPCYKYINVFAHSMGNRVLRESLNAWKKYHLRDDVPRLFRNIFLVASDIRNNSLEYGNRGEIICYSGKNVTVYHANDDMAMQASKVMNSTRVKTQRLGHFGPKSMQKVPSNVYVVDCDKFNNKYDYPKGHTYFLPDKQNKNPLLEHICSMLDSGRFSQNPELRNIILSSD